MNETVGALKQDSKIAVSLGTLVKGKQRQCTMEDALAIVASMLRAGNGFMRSVQTSSQTTDIPAQRIFDCIDAADSQWDMNL